MADPLRCPVCWLSVLAVDFQHGDPGEWPVFVGYRVGADDGKSVLWPTEEEAMRKHLEETHG